MHNCIEEKCGECYFWNRVSCRAWIHSDLPEVVTGECCRFPKREPKSQDDGCGEFKPKKVAQILREETKK